MEEKKEEVQVVLDIEEAEAFWSIVQNAWKILKKKKSVGAAIRREEEHGESGT